jgi:hypothetical protein
MLSHVLLYNGIYSQHEPYLLCNNCPFELLLNPLLQYIGIGSAAVVDRIEIKWPVTDTIQILEQVKADLNYKIKEGKSIFKNFNLSRIDFKAIRSGLIKSSLKKQ